MSDSAPSDPLKAALGLIQSAGSMAGLDFPRFDVVYRRRTPEHIAEVARLVRQHEGMTAGIDRFAASRAAAYDEKLTEVLIDIPDVPGAGIAVSQLGVKQS